MIWATNEVVGIMVFLLPGLVASAIFYSLTSHPKPNEFGQVVQALMFTILSQAASWAISLLWPQMGRREDWQLFFPVPVAAAIALIAAFCSNHDTVHRMLRWARVTRETSYPSEWYSAFAENDDCYVVLHFQDGRRLYGWPQEWPSHPGGGHFIVAEGEWLVDDERFPVEGASVILIPAHEVKMVELVKDGGIDRQSDGRKP